MSWRHNLRISMFCAFSANKTSMPHVVKSNLRSPEETTVAQAIQIHIGGRRHRTRASQCTVGKTPLAHKIRLFFFTVDTRRKPTFVKLVTDLYGTMDMRTETGEGSGRVFDPSERVAVFLYRVGVGMGVRQVATQFELSEGTVYNATIRVANRVLDRLMPTYVKWPEPDEQEHISAVWGTREGT